MTDIVTGSGTKEYKLTDTPSWRGQRYKEISINIGSITMNVYKALAEGGGFNLPFLVHLYDPDGNTKIYLINDNDDFEYDGQTYGASSFHTPRTATATVACKLRLYTMTK